MIEDWDEEYVGETDAEIEAIVVEMLGESVQIMNRANVTANGVTDMRHKPYDRNKPETSSGYVGPFATRQQAEQFLAHALTKGCQSARITAHSSHVMTSDNNPIVLNVTRAVCQSYQP